MKGERYGYYSPKNERKRDLFESNNIRRKIIASILVIIVTSPVWLHDITGKLRESDQTSDSDWEKIESYAQVATDLLIQRAANPEPDQLTWPSVDSPTTNTSYNYAGIVAYVTNKSMGQVGDEDVRCISIGDADNDGDNDMVLGTAPLGLVILYENIDNTQSFQLNSSVIANFSNQYQTYPTYVNDILIEDLEGTGNNSILVGTWHYTSDHFGDIIRIEKSSNGWQQTEVINGVSKPILGGINSLAVGEIGDNAQKTVVVGQGGTSNLDYCNVTVYTKQLGVWKEETVAITNQSRVVVCIGDFSANFDGNEIIYCTYCDNSTLGYVAYETNTYTHHIIDQYIVRTGDPPPYTRFMCVDIGDLEGDGSEELVVAFERDTIGTSSIGIYQGMDHTPIAENLEFISPEIIFDDFDNDGQDEIMYSYTTGSIYPIYRLMYYNWNESSGTSIFLENTTSLVGMAVGDIDTDGELEFLYGTQATGMLKMWDHPRGALWPDEWINVDVRITVPHSWIYEGQTFPCSLNIQNLGPPTLHRINVTIELQDYERKEKSVTINELSAGLNEIISLELLPPAAGQYLVLIKMTADSPKVTLTFEFNLKVKPRIPLQVYVGQALLELGRYTNNVTLLDAATKVGNWLRSVGVQAGRFQAWNADPHKNSSLVPGYILSTIRTGSYFLDLYKTLGDPIFLETALNAANFLADPSEGNFTQVTGGGVAWRLDQNGVAEAAEAGEFLLEINNYTNGNYSQTLTGVNVYLHSIANIETESMNWYNSAGLTQAVGQFFALQEGTFKELSLWVGNWLTNKTLIDTTWLNNLSPSVRAEDPFDYHTETGLTGVGQALVSIGTKAECDYLSEIELIANKLVTQGYFTVKGVNWHVPAWTTNITTLVQSINWDWGAAGIASFLANVYNLTETSVYLNYAIAATQWINNSLSVIRSTKHHGNSTTDALAGVIHAMMDISYIIKPSVPTTTTTTTVVPKTSTPTTQESTSTTTTTEPKTSTAPRFLIFLLFLCTVVMYRRKRKKTF